MVGIVIFKNFETGSYEHMRVTLYKGHSYSDMDRQDDFSSCLVSLEKRSVIYDFSSGSNAPRPGMHAVLELCVRAREYFYEHDWITMADFLANGDDVSFRIRSVKSGIYAPVDVRGLFDYKSYRLYRLCMEENQSHLCLSVRCSIVNYCLRHILGVEEKVFGISGRGIYADVSLFSFCRRSMKVLAVPREIRKLIKTRKSAGVAVNTCTAPRAHDNTCANTQPHMALVAYWRNLKTDTLRAACIKYNSTSMCAAEIALDMIKDEEIKKSSAEFTDELLDYLSYYEFYFEAKSHMNYICVEDALCLMINTDAADETAQRAAALSANMKLRKRLPCADYYDSHGRAYNV